MRVNVCRLSCCSWLQLLLDLPAAIVNNITSFAVVFLAGGFVFNPYVRAKLVQVLRTHCPG